LGSFERFCGILIEHFAAGSLQIISSLWLALEQIRILTVSEKFGEYGNAVLKKLQLSGLRASLDNRGEKIGAKIREGRLDLVPYLAVVGAKEAENGSVALRGRKEGELGELLVPSVLAEPIFFDRITSMTQCDLCPRQCTLSEGQTGICGVRTCRDGNVSLLSYGKTTGFAVDPIEKKPLNHFYPGSKILSFGSIGCNLSCQFCQNATTAQSRDLSLLTTSATPEDIVRLATQHHCESVAFTYNEPIISKEYVLDVAAACRSAGLKTVAVSNGFISEKCRSDFFDSMDAANIDLKSFSDTFYRDYCNGEIEPVKDTLRYLARSHTWLEVTTLLIPSLNDSDVEIDALCNWFSENLGREIPLHFSAFHPAHKLLTLPSTSAPTLHRAREIALSFDLCYVYTGNIDDPAGQTTYCPQCDQPVIIRHRFTIDEYKIDEESCCKYCGQTINGRFAES